MVTIGKVHNVSKKLDFEWRIDNFFSISERVEKHFFSPSFLLAGEFWKLKIYPNGKKYSGFVSLYLLRNYTYFNGSEDPTISVEWSFSLETCDKKRAHEIQLEYEFDYTDEEYGIPKFLERSLLLEKKSELVPSGNLTLVCTVKSYSKFLDEYGKFFVK